MLFIHCAYMCTKANRVLGMIARTVVYRNPDVLTRLYKSLVRPHLEYCVSAWSPHYVKDRERLERCSIDSQGWGRSWRAWSMEGDWRGWTWWLWRREGTVRILLNCSKSPKDCPPFHGIHSSVRTILIEQEVTRWSWQRKDSSWISGNTSFHKEWWTGGMDWVGKWYWLELWKLSKENGWNEDGEEVSANGLMFAGS